MPFYEYECPHCGYDEEVLQKINDKPLTKCPSCGKKGLRKLMSAPVLMRGGGFGLLTNIVLGVIGAFIGGFIFAAVGVTAGGLIGQIVIATVGAAVLLFVTGLLKK
jgi:putative FmdB family regulatory protein